MGGFFETAGAAISAMGSSNPLGALLDVLSGNTGGAAPNIYAAASAAQLFGSDSKGLAWSWSGQDWYKVFPYAFEIEVGEGDEADISPRFIYTLPIPPQSMTTKMIVASSATATLGGVVEETSDNVFWAIQLAGTTGTGVSRGEIVDAAGATNDRKKVADKFRKKLQTTGLLAGVAAELQTLVGTVGGTADAVLDAGNAFASGDITGGIGGVVGAVNNALLPKLPYNGSSVDEFTNGYTEMQELHRFLYTYSHLKSIDPKKYRLFFVNYKASQAWRVIVQDFTIMQNAQNPNLYRYNIQLKAWGIQDVNGVKGELEVDRFKPGGDLAPVNTVGADGLYKAFKTFSNTMKGNPGSAPETYLGLKP